MSQTAVENLSQDFGWVLPLANSFAANPIWALTLGGIVSLLIWRRQTLLGHELGLTAERRNICRELIQKAEPVIVKTDNSIPMRLNPDLLKLWTVQKEIHLLCGQNVCDAADFVVSAVEECVGCSEGLLVCSDGKERDLGQAFHFEINEFVRAARIEVAR